MSNKNIYYAKYTFEFGKETANGPFATLYLFLKLHLVDCITPVLEKQVSQLNTSFDPFPFHISMVELFISGVRYESD